MTWKPITEKPASRVPITALIAFRDRDMGQRDDFVLLGLYLYRDGLWLDEDTMKPLRRNEECEYWWVAEDEVLQELERQASEIQEPTA